MKRQTTNGGKKIKNPFQEMENPFKNNQYSCEKCKHKRGPLIRTPERPPRCCGNLMELVN